MSFLDDEHEPKGPYFDDFDKFMEWRLKTASGVLESRKRPHIADLMATDDDGEWDTETFW